MKKLKLVLAIIGTYTFAEFITMWRMQDPRLPLKEYTKTYFGLQKETYEFAKKVGEDLAEGDIDAKTARDKMLFEKIPKQ